MHKRLTHQKIIELRGNRLHCFHQNVMNRETKCGVLCSSVFGNANLSNLSGTVLEGNEDHLLNQATSDPATRELHVESLNKCIGDLQKRTEAQDVRTRFF